MVGCALSHPCGDLHLIGHSRGAVVISQALLALQANPGLVGLELGYFKMTMLDPHPVRNNGSLAQGMSELHNGTGISTVGSFSFHPTRGIPRSLAARTLRFQEAAQDPPVIIPENVDDAESYYQRKLWNETTGLDSGFNVWGELPNAILNPYNRPFIGIDVSSVVTGHIGVQTWYLGLLD
jgi:hypothetical protein